jgi:two-component system nitrogen regulation sensor histidine kinase NtrY
LANVGAGVVAIDRGGEVTTFNRAAAQLLNIDPAQAAHRPYSELFSGPLAELIARALSGTNGNFRSEKTQWTTSEGSREEGGEGARTLTALATPLSESEGLVGVVVVVDDMTHLIKGQREMAWREVARRIAHEIKNPLTPIKLSAQRLQRRLGPGRDGSSSRAQDMAILLECTDTIIKHTDELKEMVNEFSNFARFPEASPAPHDLNAAIEEVARLYRQAHQDVAFKFELEPKLPVFDFDRDQLKRVMINLLDNAVAAVGAVPLKKVSVVTHYNAQLEMAAIEVKDNGPGMPEETRARAFEPYFSTKKDGTGLGLAIAKRIVNDHDGFIRVHSAPGEGTQFVIELPTSRRQNTIG